MFCQIVNNKVFRGPSTDIVGGGDWRPCRFEYNGEIDLRYQDWYVSSFEIHNDYVIAKYSAKYKSISQIKIAKLMEVQKLEEKKLWTDIPWHFANGNTASIQYRDEIDRLNLTNVHQYASRCIVLGAPNTQLVYRTADNIIQTLTASEMDTMCVYIMGVKQSVKNVSWTHKDALRLLGTGEMNEVTGVQEPDQSQEILKYDFSTGWPA